MKRCNCTLTHSRNITPKTKNKFNAGNGQQLVVDVNYKGCKRNENFQMKKV